MFTYPVLRDGCVRANAIAEVTLTEVRAAMAMRYRGRAFRPLASAWPFLDNG
jgi:hypothetical protein